MNNQKILTKNQYLEINRTTFVGLTKNQKDEKYKRYHQKYLNKDKSVRTQSNANNRQIVPYSGNSSKNSGGVPRGTLKSMKTRIPNGMEFKLSKCLLAYARASIDPFDNITDMPCIPDTLIVPSYKFRTYLEADVTVGMLGVGWAVMNPFHMPYNNNGASAGSVDFPVVATNATYAPNNYGWTVADLGTGDVSGYNPQSQLVATVQNFEKYRLVAAGMELDYTGVLLDQAGLVSVIQWDGLNTIPNPTAISTIRQHPRSQTCATSREARCYTRFEPVTSTNFSYLSREEYYPSSLITPVLYYPLGIFVSGATPLTTFRIRAVAFFEIQSVNLPATPSEADPVGFPAFQAARSAHLPTPDPQSDLLSILKRTAGNILTSISGFAPAIGAGIGSLFGQPAIGGVLGGMSKDLIQSLFGA